MRAAYDDVMQKDKASDHEALSGLDPVDARVDVDGVSAEDSEHAHVNVVENAKVDHAPEEGLQEAGYHDAGHTVVGHEKGESGNGRNDQLVPPLEVDHVVDETQEHSHASGEEPCVVLHELWDGLD